MRKNLNNLISVVREPKHKQGFLDHAFCGLLLAPGARPITFPSPVMPDLIGHLPLYLSNQFLLRSVFSSESAIFADLMQAPLMLLLRDFCTSGNQNPHFDTKIDTACASSGQKSHKLSWCVEITEIPGRAGMTLTSDDGIRYTNDDGIGGGMG